MTTIMAPLVGTFHRQGGKFILAALPAQTILGLTPEPENPYDEKAIRVWVSLQRVPQTQFETLRENLLGAGLDWDEMLASNEPFHLGYIADSDGKICRDLGCNGNREVAELISHRWDVAKATLHFGADGKPLIMVEIDHAQ